MFELSLRFLANPYDCWKIGGKKARSLVVRLVFDVPLTYPRETGRLSIGKANIFNVLEDSRVPEEGLVLLEGEKLNSLFQELADWEAQLKALNEPIPSFPENEPGGLEP